MHCPCGRTRPYAACCGSLHRGGSALTAEDLMRSRYAAYVQGEVAYLLATVHPLRRAEHDPASIVDWSRRADWLGLQVHRALAGQPGQDVGLVDFTASWRESGKAHSHREHSVFRRLDGCWYYVDGGGDALLPGRKEPCLCGSGRPFKRCCGA